MNMPKVDPNKVGKILKNFIGTALIAGAAAPAVKYGIIDPMTLNSRIRKSEAGILSRYPNLQQEDPQKVKEYFNVVRQFSPSAAANPLVAGSLVNKMVQFGGVDHKLVQDLTGIESNAGKGTTLASGLASAAIGGL